MGGCDYHLTFNSVPYSRCISRWREQVTKGYIAQFIPQEFEKQAKQNEPRDACVTLPKKHTREEFSQVRGVVSNCDSTLVPILELLKR